MFNLDEQSTLHRGALFKCSKGFYLLSKEKVYNYTLLWILPF